MRYCRALALILPLSIALAGCPSGDDDDDPGPSPIVINEFMADNESLFEDAEGKFPDWIELFNTGTADLALGGYALSDSLGQPLLHLLSDDLVIASGGYLVLFADNDTVSGPDHLSFKLEKNGEEVVLSRLVNNIPEIIDSYAFAAQLTDISEGRSPNGTGDFTELDPPSPGVSNNN
jgi:hypothetical protein